MKNNYLMDGDFKELVLKKKSHRILKLEKIIRNVASEHINQLVYSSKFDLNNFNFITIKSVILSKDISSAKIILSCEKKNLSFNFGVIEKNIKHQLSKELPHLRRIPDIKFYFENNQSK